MFIIGTANSLIAYCLGFNIDLVVIDRQRDISRQRGSQPTIEVPVTTQLSEKLAAHYQFSPPCA